MSEPTPEVKNETRPLDVQEINALYDKLMSPDPCGAISDLCANDYSLLLQVLDFASEFSASPADHVRSLDLLSASLASMPSRGPAITALAEARVLQRVIYVDLQRADASAGRAALDLLALICGEHLLPASVRTQLGTRLGRLLVDVAVDAAGAVPDPNEQKENPEQSLDESALPALCRSAIFALCAVCHESQAGIEAGSLGGPLAGVLAHEATESGSVSELLVQFGNRCLGGASVRVATVFCEFLCDLFREPGVGWGVIFRQDLAVLVTILSRTVGDLEVGGQEEKEEKDIKERACAVLKAARVIGEDRVVRSAMERECGQMKETARWVEERAVDEELKQEAKNTREVFERP